MMEQLAKKWKRKLLTSLNLVNNPSIVLGQLEVCWPKTEFTPGDQMQASSALLSGSGGATAVLLP